MINLNFVAPFCKYTLILRLFAPLYRAVLQYRVEYEFWPSDEANRMGAWPGEFFAAGQRRGAGKNREKKRKREGQRSKDEIKTAFLFSPWFPPAGTLPHTVAPSIAPHRSCATLLLLYWTLGTRNTVTLPRTWSSPSKVTNRCALSFSAWNIDTVYYHHVGNHCELSPWGPLGSVTSPPSP